MSTRTRAHVATNLSLGGRWTSLRLLDREWLWHRDDSQRSSVRPDQAFIDAGGIEECVPTVRGTPDHGAAWSRVWYREQGDDVVDCGEFRLRRRLHRYADRVVAGYRLIGRPGFRFLWAAHALLDVSTEARLDLPAGTPIRVYPEAAAHLGGWPEGARYLLGRWPEPCGLPLSRLGPDDGSAIAAIAPGCARATVIDGDDRLSFSLRTASDVPTSTALWRNLAGYPAANPYRSIGVEPMLGSVFDLADAGPQDAATVPASGQLDWQLHITAERIAS